MFITKHPDTAPAFAFAKAAHRGQRRKYTGEPYITHPLTVAQLTYGALKGHESVIQAVKAALLHDVVEDCGVSPRIILKEFGPQVSAIVETLTHEEVKGNRAFRMAMSETGWPRQTP